MGCVVAGEEATTATTAVARAIQMHLAQCAPLELRYPAAIVGRRHGPKGVRRAAVALVLRARVTVRMCPLLSLPPLSSSSPILPSAVVCPVSSSRPCAHSHPDRVGQHCGYDHHRRVVWAAAGGDAPFVQQLLQLCLAHRRLLRAHPPGLLEGLMSRGAAADCQH